MLEFGDISVQIVSGGSFRLDGGGMFGVVPKVLWERSCPPDERNRIQMDANCLLIQSEGRNFLIDSGIGTKFGDRERTIFAVDEGDWLIENLAAVGVRPQDVETVILTHLHFDHAGGCTRIDPSGQVTPTFPAARHVIQKTEWEDATGRLPELKGTYLERDFECLGEAGLVELIDGDVEIHPGITCRRTGGHTRGHQAIVLGGGESCGVYPGDICPTPHHLKTAWTMAFDQFPRDIRLRKRELLGEAADKGWTVLFDHDPRIKAAKIGRDARDEFFVEETVLSKETP